MTQGKQSGVRLSLMPPGRAREYPSVRKFNVFSLASQLLSSTRDEFFEDRVYSL